MQKEEDRGYGSGFLGHQNNKKITFTRLKESISVWDHCIFSNRHTLFSVQGNHRNQTLTRGDGYTMQTDSRMAIASDHAGYELKEHVKKYCEGKGIACVDLSAPEFDPADDYPLFGFKMAQAIVNGDVEKGILICGTGIGISIAANRFKGVRAALCTSAEMANMAKEHNNANVLVMGGRTTETSVAEQMVDAWINGSFGRDRHERRVMMLDQPPEN